MPQYGGGDGAAWPGGEGGGGEGGGDGGGQMPSQMLHTVVVVASQPHVASVQP